MKPAYRVGRPSAHLSWEEWRCKDGTWVPLELQDNAIATSEEFEIIRARCGNLPIGIESAYRTAAYNLALPRPGAQNSQHLYARALDLHPPAQMPLGVFVDLIRTRVAEPGCPIRGVGHYTTSAHIDLRPTGRLAVWRSFVPAHDASGGPA